MVARERYAFPGGYELFAVTDDGGLLCCDCCRIEAQRIAEAFEGDGFYVVAYDSTANGDMDSFACDHCGRTIYTSPADACEDPDTDGALRNGLHYGYCARCGWESDLTADPLEAHEMMELHRLAANERALCSALVAEYAPLYMRDAVPARLSLAAFITGCLEDIADRYPDLPTPAVDRLGARIAAAIE